MAFKLLNAYYAYSQSFYLTQFKTPSKTVFMITNCMLEKFAHYVLKLSPKYLTAILYGANYVVRKRKMLFSLFLHKVFIILLMKFINLIQLMIWGSIQNSCCVEKFFNL